MSAVKTENPGRTRDVLRAVHEFDKAILNHTLWLKKLHANLICGTPVTPANLLEDAHHHCEFGQWFYGQSLEKFRPDPACDRIRMTHKAMHDAARNMVFNRDAEQRIRPEDYDDFMDLAIQFKQEVRGFQFSLISRICSVDLLTGTWNRQAMHVKLAEEAERTHRSGQPCAMCMMDLDHFRRINEEFGHAAGDEILQYVTDLVSAELRAEDSLFRYGGEVFLLLLPNSTLRESTRLLNRIREKLAATPLRLPSGDIVRLTASFGVASLVPDEPPEDALEQVDHALLAAKAQGRNRVCVWDMGSDGKHLVGVLSDAPPFHKS